MLVNCNPELPFRIIVVEGRVLCRLSARTQACGMAHTIVQVVAAHAVALEQAHLCPLVSFLM